MAKIALETADVRAVVEEGERAEGVRALAIAELLLAQSVEGSRVNRLVNALSVFGVDQHYARGAVKALIDGGRFTVVAGAIRDA